MSDYPSEKAKTTNVIRKEQISSPSLRKPRLSIWATAERITRNFACTVLIIVAAYAVKESRLPESNIVYTAANSMIEVPWEETLGRIQFVNAVFPETDNIHQTYYGMPELLSGSTPPVTHAWIKDEPYLSFRTDAAHVLTGGLVDHIQHQADGTLTVLMIHDNGYASEYHNLSSCDATEGTQLEYQQLLGKTKDGEMIYVMKYDGIPIDPTSYLSSVAP